jgi:hypothetical protein
MKSFHPKIFNSKVAVMSLLHHSTSSFLTAGMSFGILLIAWHFVVYSVLYPVHIFSECANLSKVKTSSVASALYLLNLRLKPSIENTGKHFMKTVLVLHVNYLCLLR